jgi:hypothetical protein
MSKKTRRSNVPDFNFVPEDLISYTDYKCLDFLCSSDDILERIRYDFAIIFKNMREEKFDLSTVLPNDDRCMCDLGWGARPFVNKQYCVACELIRRLCSDVKLNESRFLTIETGKHIGKTYKFIKHNQELSPYTRNLEMEKLLHKMSSMEYDLCLLDGSYYNIFKNTQVYTTTSNVSNYIMTNIFMNNKMMKYKLPNKTLIFWAFSCANKTEVMEEKSLSFMEISMIEQFHKQTKTPMAQSKVNPLNINIVKSILKQLIVLLHFFNKYSFVHGQPTVEYLRFTHKPCVYKYNNITIESPITLHLKPSLLSSFTFESDKNQYIRLIGKADVKPFVKDFPVEYTDIIVNQKKKSVNDSGEIPMIEELKTNLVYGYRIGSRLNNFINLVSYEGLPLLHSSFEFYSFMISLLCEDSFYMTFMESDSLKIVWYNLWKATEYETMMESLRELKLYDSVSLDQITMFLSEYTLRSDAIKFFWDSIFQS